MTDGERPYGFATRAVHAGQVTDPSTGAHATAIHQTSTFVLGDVARGARLFAGDEAGYVYSRIGNPTVRAFEEKLAALEGADEAVAFASGMGAIAALCFSTLRSGDEILFLGPLYGGTRGLFHDLLGRFGVRARRVDDHELASAVSPTTRMIYVETPTNPTLQIHDLRLVSEVARTHGVLSVVDGTFATPYLTRPLEHGIDVVIHSATKYLGGHGDALGGVVLGRAELMDEIRLEGLRHAGAALSPTVASLLLRGVRTLHLRMRAHCENARAVADASLGHPALRAVHYPGHAQHPGHAVASRQMNDFGGMVTLEFTGGRAMAAAFLESLTLFDHAVSLGDVSSLACHPASTTHQLVDEPLRLADGVTEGLVRLSVGVEDAHDLVRDVLQALAVAARKVERAPADH
ncbi:PLP-dependent aspartate aminotransferase family protein [soil metagenome]